MGRRGCEPIGLNLRLILTPGHIKNKFGKIAQGEVVEGLKGSRFVLVTNCIFRKPTLLRYNLYKIICT